MVLIILYILSLCLIIYSTLIVSDIVDLFGCFHSWSKWEITDRTVFVKQERVCSKCGKVNTRFS